MTITLTTDQHAFLTALLKQVTVSASDPKAAETIAHVQVILGKLADDPPRSIQHVSV